MLKISHLSTKKFTICVIFFVTIFSFVKNQNQPFNSNRLLTKFRYDTPDPQFHHINYIWTIGRPHFYLENNSINSTTFSAATNEKFKWYLTLEPSFTYNEENSFGVYAYLIFDNDTQKVLVNYSIAILNPEQEIIEKKCDPNLHEIDDQGWGDEFVKRDENFFDNKLTISFNLTFCEYIATMGIDTSQRPSIPEYNPTDNFASLYKTRKYPDVELIGNETRHPAHKDVLSLRSSVFAAMFKNAQEKGKKIKRINITDLNDQVVEEMLRYIYTGKCENFHYLVDGLLVAAQKYNLTRLKMSCVDALSEKLSVENALNTLLFADKNGVDELKSNAIRFIVKNDKIFSNNTDWEHFIQKKPQIVHEVCQIVSKSNFGDVIQKYCT